ncbi:MAG: hypothetical protein methR_P3021 [Methyloprofundus sp.]|nr:MAG: hypothetical protein methR_P3021 [Methyloprofundus sp.]
MHNKAGPVDRWQRSSFSKVIYYSKVSALLEFIEYLPTATDHVVRHFYTRTKGGKMKRRLFILLMIITCCGVGNASGAEQENDKTSATHNNDLDIFLEPVNSLSSIAWNSIKVRSVYVPDPLGMHGIVGQYECPLKSTDRGSLRELTVSHFIEHKLSILFDKGSDNLTVVIALMKTKQSNEFIAYRVRIDLKILPVGPTRGGIVDCDILVSAHRISGKVKEGKRDLIGATYSDDEITQGLMAKFREFSSNAAERSPRSSSPSNFNFKMPFGRLF